jgi:hypothetical protein
VRLARSYWLDRFTRASGKVFDVLNADRADKRRGQVHALGQRQLDRA